MGFFFLPDSLPWNNSIESSSKIEFTRENLCVYKNIFIQWFGLTQIVFDIYLVQIVVINRTDNNVYKIFQIPNYEFVDYLKKKTHSIFVRYHLAIFTISVNTNVSFLNS